MLLLLTLAKFGFGEKEVRAAARYIEAELSRIEAETVARESESALDAWVNEGGPVDRVEAYYAGGNDPDAILTVETVEYVPAYEPVETWMATIKNRYSPIPFG